MSEEQPVFKVTDRRLFNPDGTPRDIPREEEAKPQPAGGAEKSSHAAASSEAPSAGEQATTARGGGATSASSEQRGDAESSPSHAHEDDYAESDIPGADDPASFVNFLMSIASNAAASLGMMEHPATGERRVDLELAKHWIDILGMLKEKTTGNLSPQEQQIFDSLLADLRMQFVSLTSTRQPKPPRGFSGSDITGGR